MNISNYPKLINFKQFKSLLSFNFISLVVFIGSLAVIFISFHTISYYHSKSHQWFDKLPSQTVLAVKLNAHTYKPVQNTKLLSILKDFSFDQSLIDEFINFRGPLTFLLFNHEQKLVSGVILDTSSAYEQSDKFTTSTLSDTKVLLSNHQDLAVDLKSDFNQTNIKTQIKNHPSTSFGYIAFSPQNFQQTFFKNKLLTPSQKAVESLLKHYDNIFFNIESDDNKLFISNYLEEKSKNTSFISLDKLALAPSNPVFHATFTALQNRMPTILKLSLEKILNNFGVSKDLYQKFLASNVSISLDTNNQWHVLVDSKQKLTNQDLLDTINFLTNYFNPIQTERILKTNQETKLNIAQNIDLPNVKNTAVLASINKNIKITPQSEYLWRVTLSNINTSLIDSKLNFQPSTLSAFENIVDYSKFRLDFLSQLFGPKLPAYSLEIFQRDYSFGKHTLMVIE